MNAETGKYIIIPGLLLMLVGAAVYFFHDKLNWVGRLPGDIRIERENFRFYFPFTKHDTAQYRSVSYYLDLKKNILIAGLHFNIHYFFFFPACFSCKSHYMAFN